MKLQEINNFLKNSRIAINFKPIKWRYKIFFQKKFPFFKKIKVIDEVEIIDSDLLMEATLDYHNEKMLGYITKMEWIKK